MQLDVRLKTVDADKLPSSVDLILVLGWRRNDDRYGPHNWRSGKYPVMGVNFGGLGYLAEFSH